MYFKLNYSACHSVAFRLHSQFSNWNRFLALHISLTCWKLNLKVLSEFPIPSNQIKQFAIPLTVVILPITLHNQFEIYLARNRNCPFSSTLTNQPQKFFPQFRHFNNNSLPQTLVPFRKCLRSSWWLIKLLTWISGDCHRSFVVSKTTPLTAPAVFLRLSFLLKPPPSSLLTLSIRTSHGLIRQG